MMTRRASLLDLPAELIANIFHYLGPDSLSALSASHPQLDLILQDDFLWRQSVLREFANKSSFRYCEVISQDLRPSKSETIMDASSAPLLENPSPYGSYRELYTKVLKNHGSLIGTWAGNTRWLGSLIEIFYSHWSGKVECRRIQLDAIVGPTRSFSLDSEVQWRDLNPILRAWVDPLFELRADSTDHDFMVRVTRVAGISDEVCRSNNLQLEVWPTVNVPAHERVHLNQRRISPELEGQSTSRSNNLISISRPVLQAAFETDPFFEDFDNIPRHAELFYRLPRDLPVPALFEQHSGLFIGDYSSHGAELLYLYYPTPTTLHAVKVTGDPNIPRGELSWVIDNITTPLRICEESEWPGARAFSGRGQVSPHAFSNPTWMEVEVILYHARSDRIAHSLQSEFTPAEVDRMHAQEEHLSTFGPATSATKQHEDEPEGSSDSGTPSSYNFDVQAPFEWPDSYNDGPLQVERASVALWWKDMAHISQFHKIGGVSDRQKFLLESMLDRYLVDP